MNSCLLISFLKAAAAVQIVVAVLNLFLTRILDWRQDVLKMPLLLREVFHVHAWFISVTLAIFGVLTWRFSAEFASRSDSIGQWLAAAIGFFWAFRTALQIGYYSASHWRGQFQRTLIHVTLLLMYGGMAGVYLYSSFGR
jgi:hypothetical protein